MPSSARIRSSRTCSASPPSCTQPEGALGNFDKGTSQIYLDVWERLVTYVEDDSIREVALNGPDTAARTKVVWQIGAMPTHGGPLACSPAELRDRLQPVNRGRLRARGEPAPAAPIRAPSTPTRSYRGHGEPALPRRDPWRRAAAAKADASSGRARTARSLPRRQRQRQHGSTWNRSAATIASASPMGTGSRLEDDASVLSNRVTPLLPCRSPFIAAVGASPVGQDARPTSPRTARRIRACGAGTSVRAIRRAGGLTLGAGQCSADPDLGGRRPERLAALEDGVADPVRRHGERGLPDRATIG